MSLLLLVLLVGACESGLIQPGGQYSGVPDTRMGDWRRNQQTGTISNSGVMTVRP